MRLLFAPLIVGREVQARSHSHHVLQVSISLDSPFHLQWTTKNTALNSADFEGVIIAPDQKHSLDGRGGMQALLLIDPEYTCAQQLMKKWLGEEAVSSLPASLRDPLVECLTTDPALSDPITTLLGMLLTREICLAPIDRRVRTALDYLQSQTIKNVAASVLAKELHLSESRLAHLFKQQVGIPVRRYIMWLRLMDAIECVFAGNNLTEAAAHAGFSDSARFSRTFRSMFGVPPSLVIQHSKFIQVT